MTTITKLVSALAALAACASGFAQTAPANPAVETSGGLLGHRYAEYAFGYLDINNSDIDAFGAGLTVNLPVAPSIDVSWNYTYSWLEGHRKNDAHDVSATGIYYIDTGKLRPFGGLEVGYSWNDWSDGATWGALAGVEYQVNTQLVLRGSVGYSDDFRRGNDAGTFDGTVRGNYWLTHNLSVFLEASLIEGGNRGIAGGVSVKF